MRLIDADALEKFLKNARSHLPYQTYTSAMELDIRDNALLNLQQMVHLRKPVDAEPVVRCKDCRYCDPENKHCDHPMGTLAPFPRKDDDFCSYGERKDVASDGE